MAAIKVYSTIHFLLRERYLIPKQYKKINDTEIIVSFVASVSHQHPYEFGHIRADRE